MNRVLILLITAIAIIGGFLGLFYYSFTQIDFIGSKDPKVVKANVERWDKMLLKAEYRSGTDYFKISLLDSATIEINAGNASRGTILTKQYTLSGDTIILIDGIKNAGEFLSSSEMLIQNDRVLYFKDSDGNFDTTQALKVKFNRLWK